MATHRPWHVKPGEDELVRDYQLRKGGTVYFEVPVGGEGGRPIAATRWPWPPRSKPRYIDAIWVPPGRSPEGLWHSEPEELLHDVQLGQVDVIEAKRCLSDAAIGQAIAGADMFDREYPRQLSEGVHGAAVRRRVVLCPENPDATLVAAAHRLGVDVETVSSPFKNKSAHAQAMKKCSDERCCAPGRARPTAADRRGASYRRRA